METGATRKKTIEVTDEELTAFRQFQRILPDVMIMLKSDVFDFKSGHMEIHRDSLGVLRKITMKKDTYISTPQKHPDVV